MTDCPIFPSFHLIINSWKVLSHSNKCYSSDLRSNAQFWVKWDWNYWNWWGNENCCRRIQQFRLTLDRSPIWPNGGSQFEEYQCLTNNRDKNAPNGRSPTMWCYSSMLLSSLDVIFHVFETPFDRLKCWHGGQQKRKLPHSNNYKIGNRDWVNIYVKVIAPSYVNFSHSWNLSEARKEA